MDQKAAKRFGLATEAFLNQINSKATRKTPGQLHDEYRLTSYPDRRDIVYGIVQKALPGKPWPDGQNWRQVGRITWKQATIIEQTSQSVDEIVQRLEQLIVHGNDTTRSQFAQPGQVNEQDIEKRVAERVEAILSRKIAEIMEGQKPIAQVVAETAPTPSGIQYQKNRMPKQGTQRKRGERKVAIAQELALWKERFALMGMPEVEPKITVSGANLGFINKVWLRPYAEKWDRYCKKTEAVPAN